MDKNVVIEKGKKGSWVDLGSNDYEPDYNGKPKGKRKHIPLAVLREIAHQRTDGGTAICFVCHTQFAMYYIRRCRVSSFRIEHVCCDCAKLNGYPKVD
jgi:hypothetical protein